MWSVFINRHSEGSPFHFSDLLELQEKLLPQFQASKQSALLFAEVAPIVTLGDRQAHAELDTWKAKGLQLSPGHRGGKETWHGPGQWVGFVLASLESFTGDPKGVRKSVYGILERLLVIVREYDPEARIEEGDRLGIWSKAGKLVSVGIRIRSGWITSGFALNVIPRPESFAGIDPCGLKGERPDFLFKNRVKSSDWEREFAKLPSKIAAIF